MMSDGENEKEDEFLIDHTYSMNKVRMNIVNDIHYPPELTIIHVMWHASDESRQKILSHENIV